MNANVKSATIHSRSFDEKHLQDHEESKIQTLVVNLPMNKSTTCQIIAFQEVAPHSKEIENQEQELKCHSHNESKLCYDQNEGKTSSIYMIS
jgi:hypothetical protein